MREIELARTWEGNIFSLVGKLKENTAKTHLPNIPLIIYFRNDLMTKRRDTYHHFP